tara:strand:+ start:1367 stop:1855 length:489 start_codon:yes stop_codon:yes gene_type:complete
MTAFVNQCHQIFYIDENKTFVEIYYSKYKEGKGYENLVDTFDTATTCDFNYNDKSLVRYERFLDTMVIKTIETIHKMVLIELDNVLLENKNINSLIRIMNSIKILDPTFSPPYINKKCSWQKKLVREICLDILPDVIKTSTNKFKLEKLFRTLQLIESKTIY